MGSDRIDGVGSKRENSVSRFRRLPKPLPIRAFYVFLPTGTVDGLLECCLFIARTGTMFRFKFSLPSRNLRFEINTICSMYVDGRVFAD